MNDFQPAKRLRGVEKSMIRQIFDRARPGSINLGLGEPDILTPLVVREAAARVVMEEQNGYTSHAGLPALRPFACRRYLRLKRRASSLLRPRLSFHPAERNCLR